MASKITLTSDDLREDQQTGAEAPAPAWETVSFEPGAKRRPTVTDADGRERELTDYEFQKWEESKADTAMRKEAAAAQAGTGTLTQKLMARPRVAMVPDENQIYGFQLASSLSEDRVFMLTTGEDDEVRGYLKDASDFLHSTRTTLERIDTAYRDLMLDKTMLPEARSDKLQDEVTKAFEKAYVGRGKALEAIAKKIDHTEGLLNKPLETQAASPRATELRAVLRSLPRDERNAAIRAAVFAEKPTAAQSEILQAVLGSNHITCGISEVEQQTHIRTYNSRTQPQIQRRLDLLQKCASMIESIEVKTIQSQYEGAMRSKFSRATAISGLADKARKSLAAINAG